MNAASLPWLAGTLWIPWVGALVVAFVRPPPTAARTALGVLLAALVSAIGAAVLAVADARSPHDGATWTAFRADDLSAPMLPVLGLLHLLTLLGTSKSRLAPGFCVRLLISAGVTPAAVTCQNGPVLVALFVVLLLLPWWDLRSRGRPARAFLIHAGLIVLLLVAGWSAPADPRPVWALGVLLLAFRWFGGMLPLHGWLPALFQTAGFGTALLFVLPLVEVVAVLRFLLPHAPESMLHAGAVASLVTAVYAAAMGVVQDEARRFFGWLTLSQTSMVAFAVLSHTPSSLTAALCLWISVVPALAGLGLAIRSLEARFGPLSLREHHGHYHQVPGLAIAFLLAGLASVGFPGTLGFVPMELLISGSSQTSLGNSATLAVAAMLNGIAILRAYFSLFTGKRPAPSVSLPTTAAERAGIVILSLAVLVGGWFSPSVVASRHRTAERLLERRPLPAPDSPAPAVAHRSAPPTR